MTAKGLIDSFSVMMVLFWNGCYVRKAQVAIEVFDCSWFWEIDRVGAYMNVYFFEGILIKLFLVKVIYFPYYEIMYFWTKF